jgi:serine phosphatase RsbU (regulator of sigma subunit)
VEQGGRTVLATHATINGAAAQRDDLVSYLVVIADDETIARHPIGLEPLTVGRDPARDVVLPDAQVSRLHLQLAMVGDEVIVEDLGSSNGTFFSGRRLTSPQVLLPGQAVQVGGRLLKHEVRSRREVEREEELRRDLDKARSYIQSLLPAPVASGPVRTDWYYRPSAQLGGDAFSYEFVDDGDVIAYLVDVSGHGVGPAMHSVSVLNVLRQHALPATDFRDPAQVLCNLNAMFQMDSHDGMFFTIWYGVYSRARRLLSYASAGHHPAFLHAGATAPAVLRTPGPMIGAMPGQRYQAQQVEVPAGAVLYVFSDGVFEITTTAGEQGGIEDFLPLLGAQDAGAPGECERIYRAVRARARPGPLDDDFSMLTVSFA